MSTNILKNVLFVDYTSKTLILPFAMEFGGFPFNSISKKTQDKPTRSRRNANNLIANKTVMRNTLKTPGVKLYKCQYVEHADVQIGALASVHSCISDSPKTPGAYRLTLWQKDGWDHSVLPYYG